MKKWYAVIGDPVSHSKSPAMHETWFRENRIDASYIPVHVPAGTVGDAVAALRRLGASGWNVTVPHKQTIIPYLDEVDPLASEMQAVNTVKVLPDGRLLGMNTDGPGFVRSLEERIGTARRNDRVLIIGAGGAANGIALSMSQGGYGQISVCNRTVEKAEKLCSRIGGEALGLDEAAERLGDFGIIIQTTPVGMSTATDGLPIAIGNLDPGAVVADIVYSPLHTEFLKAAMKNGNEIVDGLGMFIWQGALAFNEWTGLMPDTLGTRQRLIAEMEESTC
ncbi:MULTISPECIES: shikimate dehydrogenase [Bhargavaea]|uniref:Shikimate dehydrogenase (NADP(+)) n=1 Tax=Bhargavaea changchunensis TaxID=2134037 RepID=A0ABW2NFP0_9BACL|nr:shikimate dehydrogenase [Bhargavaea sp. CC-171006]